MRKRLSVALLLILAGLAAATGAGAGEKAGEKDQEKVNEKVNEKVKRLPIIDRAIEYHGGDVYRASETGLTITSKSGSFRVVSRVEGDLFEHTVVDLLPDGRERRTRITNDTVERTEGGQPVALDAEGERRARDFVMSRIYFPFLPFRLNDPSVYKEDLGIEEWDGRRLHKVKVTFEAGSSTDASDEYLYWLDPGSGRVEQYAYSFGTGRERGGLRFRQLTNARRAGGLLFSDAENYGVDGPGPFRVELITPEFVRGMEKVSTVLLENIQVRRLRD